MKKVRHLFEQFRPNHYKLDIDPDKQAMTFTGIVKISGKKAGRPAKRLTLHAKDLKINSVNLVLIDRSGKREINIERVVLHKAYDELRLHTNELLYPGEYEVEINFSGQITRAMNGLYPCFYKHNEQEEIILATQFESHHAREVFPCLDEPEAKAVFELTLHAFKNEVVLANTEPKITRDKEDKVVITFNPTPKMSTYLLAFVIGKVNYLEGQTKSGVRVRTYASPDIINHTKFALDTAIKCLDLYNDYFAIDYPLSKCDLVALPDFASGAMENWGLITFREQALVVDSHHTSLGMKQYVANVVAHELTHQWFGNLVTMKWWNDLWLNESFASLMSYLAVDKIFPEWQVWNQFIVEEQSQALKLDSLANTHPINVKINHPDEIRTIFDNISYEKGASVLLMLMRFLGQDDFRTGLTMYLKTHSYENSVSKDLWQSWEEVTHKPIADFMNAWTTQPGYPIVTAEVKGKKVSFLQQRFYLNPRADKENSIWPIPLFPNSELTNATLEKSKLSSVISETKPPLIINHGRSAFFRVIYNSEHIDTLKKSIKNKELNELDRQGILADSFDAAKAGFQSVVESLNLLDAYDDEDNLLVWDIIGANLAGIRTVMDNDHLRDLINPSIHKLIKKQYTRLGWSEKAMDSSFDILMRPLILGLATSSELPESLSKVKDIYASSNKKAISPNIRGVVYTTIARHGGATEFNELLKMHNETNNSEEKVTLAAALTNFKQPELIERSLGTITSKDVRLQDVAYWVSYSFANRYAKELTWQWLKTHWDWLEKNLGNDLSFYMMPRYAAKAFSDESFIPEFSTFFEAHMSESFKRTVAQAIETITWQSQWKKRDLNKLIKYYSKA